MELTRVKSNRIEWIDYSKGIAMLLVVAGHALDNSLIHYLIYSFHMPLFFTLTAVTMRFSGNGEALRRNFKKTLIHLIKPVSVFWILHTIVKVVLAQDFRNAGVLDYIKKQILSFLWASGSNFAIGSINVPTIGVFWFIFALLVAKTMYDLIHLWLHRYETVAVGLLSIIGVVIGIKTPLPFCVDCGLAVLPFFSFGKALRCKYVKSTFNRVCLLTGLIGWLALNFICGFVLKHQSMEISQRVFPLFPVCFIQAGFAVVAFSELCKRICSFLGGHRETAKLHKGLLFLGENSLLFLCVHYSDPMWSFLWKWIENQYVRLGVQLGADIVVLIILYKALYIFRHHFTRENTRETSAN